VLALSSMLALLLLHLTLVEGDLLVGPMDKDAARRLAEYRWSRNVVGPTYEWLWAVLVALGFLLIKHRTMPRNGTGSISFAWRIAWIPILIGFITLPMLFGAFVRPILYPAAAVSWKFDEQKFFLCGVLVGNEAGSVILWEQNRDYGAVFKVPERAIINLATGPLTRPLAIRVDPGGPDAQILTSNCTRLHEKIGVPSTGVGQWPSQD
jgi:hypothetical protein